MEEDIAKGIIPVALELSYLFYDQSKTLSCWGMAWSASLGEM
jgi:glycerol-3-phosphate acyltransferase PlsY